MARRRRVRNDGDRRLQVDDFPEPLRRRARAVALQSGIDFRVLVIDGVARETARLERLREQDAEVADAVAAYERGARHGG